LVTTGRVAKYLQKGGKTTRYAFKKRKKPFTGKSLIFLVIQKNGGGHIVFKKGVIFSFLLRKRFPLIKCIQKKGRGKNRYLLGEGHT